MPFLAWALSGSMAMIWVNTSMARFDSAFLARHSPYRVIASIQPGRPLTAAAYSVIASDGFPSFS